MFFKRGLIIAFLALTGFSTAVYAAEDGPRKHSVRIGWGDMLYETAVYHPTATHVFDYPAGLSGSYLVKERFNYRYTGHIFAEYSYSFNEFLSAGAMLDYGSISWENGIFDREHNLVQELPEGIFHSIVVMPTARVSYFHRGPVSLHSGLGAGMLVSVGEKAEFAPAYYVNVIGLEYGIGHWSGSIDLGALNSVMGSKRIYMLASRLVSVSVYYSW